MLDSDTVYTHPTTAGNKHLPTAANGFMSGTDKTKLDGIDAGANKITLGTTQPTVGCVVQRNNIIYVIQL